MVDGVRSGLKKEVGSRQTEARLRSSRTDVNELAKGFIPRE